MNNLARRTASVVIGLLGVLCILASGGGGGGDDSDDTASPAQIAQAKALVADFRLVANSFDDLENPTNEFSTTVENAQAVSGRCSTGALNALSLATANALDLYQDNDAADGTYTFQTDDGQGGAPVSADVVVSSPNASNDRIVIADEPVYADDGAGGVTLNRVNLDITLPVDSDTSESSPLNATITEARVVCPESGADAGVTVRLIGTLTVTRRAGSAGPTIDNIGSLIFDGDVTIAQTASATVTNPVTIRGEIDLGSSGCTVDDCTNQSIILTGTLSDMTDSTSVELAISKTATTANLSIGFDAELDGLMRAIVLSLTADITDPENPTPTEISIEMTGDDGVITIVADQFNADGDPGRLTVSDGQGGTMTITDLNSDGPVFGTILVDGNVVGTLEENSNGDLIIRYADGTFETLA